MEMNFCLVCINKTTLNKNLKKFCKQKKDFSGFFSKVSNFLVKAKFHFSTAILCCLFSVAIAEVLFDEREKARVMFLKCT
jgi:hypothetical protein